LEIAPRQLLKSLELASSLNSSTLWESLIVGSQEKVSKTQPEFIREQADVEVSRLPDRAVPVEKLSLRYGVNLDVSSPSERRAVETVACPDVHGSTSFLAFMNTANRGGSGRKTLSRWNNSLDVIWEEKAGMRWGGIKIWQAVRDQTT